MSSRGDIQKQLLQVMSKIKLEGLELEDVIPEEMQEHFNNPIALTEARQYIKDAEAREESLQNDIAKLTDELKSKQAEIDDQPEEHKALKVDLQQSQRSIDYYKELADNASSRAERYQRQLAEAQKTQTTADEDNRKIQRLQREMEDREAAMFKLLAENRTMADLHEAQCEQDQKLINEKEDNISSMINYANRIELEKNEAVQNSEQIAAAYDSLIETLEHESMTTADTLHRKSVKLNEHIQSNDQLYSALAAEIAPLKRLYDHILSILGVYGNIFKAFSNQKATKLPDITKPLDGMLDAASEDLEVYQQVSAALHNEGLAQTMVHEQIHDMAHTAAVAYNNLETIREDISGFLDWMHDHPDAQSAINGYAKSCTDIASVQADSTVPVYTPSSLSDIVKLFSPNR